MLTVKNFFGDKNRLILAVKAITPLRPLKNRGQAHNPCIQVAIMMKPVNTLDSISWKPLRFASWFPTLISCSPNLLRVYIRLCKHGNHFTFLHYNILPLSGEEIVLAKMEITFFHHIFFIVLGLSGVTHSQSLLSWQTLNQLER